MKRTYKILNTNGKFVLVPLVRDKPDYAGISVYDYGQDAAECIRVQVGILTYMHHDVTVTVDAKGPIKTKGATE